MSSGSKVRKDAHTIESVLQNRYSGVSFSQRKVQADPLLSKSDREMDLFVRDLLKSDAEALTLGVRNANDAISLIQGSDDAFCEIKNMLSKMKELAERASHSECSQEERNLCETTYQNLALEITKNAARAEFNSIYLLDGSLQESGTQERLDSEEVGFRKLVLEEYMQIGLISAATLGLGHLASENAPGYSIETAIAARRAIDGVSKAMEYTEQIHLRLASLRSSLESAIAALKVKAENIQSAKSRLADIDIANEMAIFVKQQVLLKPSTAILSQASRLQKVAMKLVR